MIRALSAALLDPCLLTHNIVSIEQHIFDQASVTTGLSNEVSMSPAIANPARMNKTN